MSQKSGHLLDALLRGQPGRGPEPVDEPEEEVEEHVEPLGYEDAVAPGPEPMPVHHEPVSVPAPVVPADPVRERVPAREREREREVEPAREFVPAAPRRAPARVPSRRAVKVAPLEDDPEGDGERRELTLSYHEAMLIALFVLVLLIGAFVIGRRSVSPGEAMPVLSNEVGEQKSGLRSDLEGPITPQPPGRYTVVAMEYSLTDRSTAVQMSRQLTRTFDLESWVDRSERGNRWAVHIGRFPGESDRGLLSLIQRLRDRETNGRRLFANTVYIRSLQD